MSTNQALGAECLSWYTLSFETEERRLFEETVDFQQQNGQTGRRPWCPPQPLERTNMNLDDQIMKFPLVKSVRKRKVQSVHLYCTKFV